LEQVCWELLRLSGRTGGADNERREFAAARSTTGPGHRAAPDFCDVEGPCGDRVENFPARYLVADANTVAGRARRPRRGRSDPIDAEDERCEGTRQRRTAFEGARESRGRSTVADDLRAREAPIAGDRTPEAAVGTQRQNDLVTRACIALTDGDHVDARDFQPRADFRTFVNGRGVGCDGDESGAPVGRRKSLRKEGRRSRMALVRHGPMQPLTGSQRA